MRILIINGHEFYEYSKGELTQYLVELAKNTLEQQGHTIQTTASAFDQQLDIHAEIEKHQWADAIVLQTPVFSMGLPWSCKKYFDDVYTEGMHGQLSNGDGRTRSDASKQYGTGGTQTGKKVMLSLTLNAPKQAFDDPNQYLFGGKSIDDLFFPVHANFRFVGLESLPTFAFFDVIKNPNLEQDFKDFQKHLKRNFSSLE